MPPPLGVELSGPLGRLIGLVDSGWCWNSYQALHLWETIFSVCCHQLLGFLRLEPLSWGLLLSLSVFGANAGE